MNQCRPYIVAPLLRPGKVNPTVELEIRTSQLKTTFPPGKEKGLFTVKPLAKGMIILAQVEETDAPFNDAQVNFTPFLRVKSSFELYQAFLHLKEDYYNLEQVQEKVNVRMVIDPRGNMFWEVIKDVPAGAELLRLYGLSTWIIETMDLLTRRNLAGYAQFVFDLEEGSEDDPLKTRIQILAETLRGHFLSDHLILPWKVDLAKYEKDHEKNEEKIGDYLIQMFHLNQLIQ